MNMSDLLELEDEEIQEMGSYNHSLAQAQLTGLFFNDKRFSVFIELSLDVSQTDLSQFGMKAKEELKPDICLYPKTEKTGFIKRDIIKMSEMPLLAIEIISPKQGIDDILTKFDAYFALGIKSCWLVIPPMEVVDIYSQLNQHRTFDMNDTHVIDELADINLPMKSLFG
jgi:Uma2 family endonuclease